MREIIFRGKSLDDGTWPQGYLFQIWDNAYILWGTTNDIPNKIEVSPETVSQYVGLRDINEKMIFDGDILLLPGFYIGEEEIPASKAKVVWGDGGWELREISEYSPVFVLDHDAAKEMTVIGNIWDNPELMETNCDGE